MIDIGSLRGTERRAMACAVGTRRVETHLTMAVDRVQTDSVRQVSTYHVGRALARRKVIDTELDVIAQRARGVEEIASRSRQPAR